MDVFTQQGKWNLHLENSILCATDSTIYIFFITFSLIWNDPLTHHLGVRRVMLGLNIYIF